MSDPSSSSGRPADSAPAETPAGQVESGTEKAGITKKVVLSREPSALDPTRYGDWEKNGRCIDF